MMTYEQAVATAFLNVREVRLQKRYGVARYKDLKEMTYAYRRLRVRAGLAP